MACNLTKDQDLAILNEISQDFINSVIKNEAAGDVAGIDELVKLVYNTVNQAYPEDLSLQFSQAVPSQVLHVITKDTQNDYLSKIFKAETPLDLNYLAELNSKFEDLDEVKSFVTTKKKLKSKKSIKEEIEKENKSSENVGQDNVPTNLISSVMTNNKPRPAYPNTTTGQMAYAENPDTVAEELKNVKDPEKKMFYGVIKTLVWFTRNNPNQEPIITMPDGSQVGVKMLAKNLQDVDKSLLTRDDKNMLKNNPSFNMITAFVSDQNGNILKFDEEGNISEEGRAVYQYIRPVIKRGDKLYLGNRAGKLYTLVDAQDLAKQEILEKLSAGIEMGSAAKNKIRGKIKADQESLLNDLYTLTQTLNGDQPLLDAQKTFPLEKLSDLKRSYGQQTMIFKASIKDILQDVDSGKSEIKLDVISEEQLKNIAKNQEEQEEVKDLTAYVLHVDGTIIGAVNVNKNGYITNSQIHPDARQRGLGGRLYNQVNQIIQKSDNILLKSDGRVSPDALALWQSLTAKGLAYLANEEAGVFAMRSERLDQTKGVVIPITGGSYGITQTTLVPLSETEFADDFNMLYIIDSGPLEGHSYFPVTRDSAGITVDEKVFLQRLDMPATLATKLAKVLTTNAKFNNEELSAQDRLSYYNQFLSNRTSKNGIRVTIEEEEGLNKIQVRLASDKLVDGKMERSYRTIDLSKASAEKIIADHLQSFVKGQFAANMSYQKEFAENGIINKDATYLDYEFAKDTNDNDVVKAVTKDYFSFIKENTNVDYTAEKDSYFAGVNAYLQFAIPEEFQTPQENLLELGYIGPVEEIDSETNTDKLKETADQRGFITYRLPNRKAMLTRNVNDSDVTFAIGSDFGTDDIAHIKSKVEEAWEFMKLGQKKIKTISDAQADRIAENLNSYGKDLTINVVGNHMGDLAKLGWEQKQLTDLMISVLKKLNKRVSIGKIIVEGDSGIGFAMAKAAITTKTPVEVVSDSKGSVKVPNKWTKSGYTIKKLNARDYIKRIYGVNWTNNFFKKKKNTPKKATVKPTVSKVTKELPASTKESTDKEIKKQSKNSIDDILGASDDFTTPLQRSKRLKSFLDKIFTSKEALGKAESWYKTSPLNEVLDFERAVGIVNSDSFGLFYNTAWALQNDARLSEQEKIKDGKQGKAVIYGDALSIDMYHEAWHGFTQLVLTPEQRESLYKEVQKIKKHSDKSFYDIEEVLSEGYRSYARSRSTKLGRVVDKIFEILNRILKALGIQTSQVQYNPAVREMFNKLYTGQFTIPAKNSIQTLEPVVLQRAKQIKALKKESKNVATFTVDDSAKAVDIVDTVMALTFQNYNKKFNTSSGALKILGNEQQKILLYKNIKAKLELNKGNLEQDLVDLQKNNLDTKNPDLLREVMLKDRVELLDKMINNFGDIELSLNRNQKKGVVAFHLEKSRFSVLKEQYLQDIDDASSVALFTTREGNAISAKELSSKETMLFLTGIFKQERNDEGDIVRQRDEFGLPILEETSLVWNKLARVLQGSFDPIDIYNRLINEEDNYLEFGEIMTMLPDPSKPYQNSVEFDTETNFWQDFKKPQIPYIQLTVNKTILQERKREGDKLIPEKSSYESRVSRANFNLYKILSDWKRNFAIASTSVNPYIIKDAQGIQNRLDLSKVVKAFSRNGQLIPGKSVDFLKALGVELDMSSYEILRITSDSEKFAKSFGVNFIFNVVNTVNKAANSNNPGLEASAMNFSKNPIYYLLNGLPKNIEEEVGKPLSVKTRLSTLATLQNRFSDGFSNYSVLSPEKNKVWEHFVDNTITRLITALNYADTWQELTGEGETGTESADPNGLFQHMRWLSTEINTQSKYSVLLRNMFDLDVNSPTYGQKKSGFNIELKNIGGTQLNVVDSSNFTGVSTANADVTTKFLQEFHTLLEAGVQEFMRHASKSTSLALTFDGLQLEGYGKNKNKSLYIDIQDFNPKNLSGVSTPGQNKGFNIVLGYLSGEAQRIAKYKENNLDIPGYNKPVIRKGTGEEVPAAMAFTIFDDVLSEDTQKVLYRAIDYYSEELASGEMTLQDMINETAEKSEEIRAQVKEDVLAYFELQGNQNMDTLNDNKYVDPVIFKEAADGDLSKGQIERVLVDAYTWNSWIHNFETLILAYGDPVQYNHAKEEFHKRNAGLASGGRSLRTDPRARTFINSDKFKQLYAEKNGYEVRPYDGTMHTAIMKEYEIKKSPQYDDYYKRHVAEYTRRFMDSGMKKAEATKKAKEFATKVLDPYMNMEVADGQGYITFEAYRMFKKLEGEWFTPQENLYKKIVESDGKDISLSDVEQFFPPLKYQYFGNIKADVLPIMSFHKFSLAPLIPGVVDNSNLADLHDKMMREQIDYVTFQTGSKISQEGNGDAVVREDGSVDNSVPFTKNIIFGEFLKNQTAVPIKYKGVSIFSTQLRKLILDGLYENGKISTKNEAEIKDALVKRYVDAVENYTKLVTQKLLDDMGFVQDENGNIVANSDESIVKLASLIRDNLTSEDILSDQLIDIIDVTDSGDLQFDLSFHPESNKIEKVLLSVINKTIIKQKVKGEALVQKSSAMYNGIMGAGFRKATSAELQKYLQGDNFLPTYHARKDGFTAAMKVMVALQGDYENLLNLEYKGKVIGTDDIEESLKTLNQAIKDDEWLDANDGANRKAITMVGVRVPVQGLNSIENMEVFHFLPPQAGNIIIPPAEIVAKSGADFDIDKLAIFMQHINSEGKALNKTMLAEFSMSVGAELTGQDKEDYFEAQKAVAENELIDIMSEILSLPENFVSLTTPNSTLLVKDIADDLAQYVMEYDPKSNFMTQDTGSLSPTRILEARYNLYKQESNVIGKKTLGLGAIENTFNTVFNYVGASMPKEYTAEDGDTRKIDLFLRHHKLDGAVSLSNLYDVDSINKISDVINQMINGWVDVEKDAWVFFIQGNYEVAPVLLTLIKSGVPVKEAIYFVSQPLVREYVKEQRILKSTFSEPLKRLPYGGVKDTARRSVINKYFGKAYQSSQERYNEGIAFAETLLEGRADKTFTQDEMYQLIKDGANIENAESVYTSDLSKAMFLHYLQAEDQMEGTKMLKLAANPDTTTMTDVQAALQSEQDIANLASEPTLNQKLKTDVIENSIISSFFNNKLISDLGKELFSFRYDDSFNYITDIVEDKAYRSLFYENFGPDYKVTVPQTFRNDFLSFLYQNAVRKYYLGNTYNNKTLNRTVPVKEVNSLRSGVAVKDDVIYIDEKQIRADFTAGIWKTSSRSKNSYSKKGLYALDINTFSNNTSNYQEYLRFVIERESLRSKTSKKEFQESQLFEDRFTEQKSVSPLSEDKLKNQIYEQYLAFTALSNTSNAYHMFNDPQYAYAIEYKNMVDKYNLKAKYDVLKRLEVDTNSDRTFYNIYLNDKDLDNFKSNLYTKNLADLADRTVSKVDDVQTNNYISDFFANMTNFAAMQSGITRTKYNFLGLTNFNSFINTLSPLVNNYLNSDAVTKQELLTEFLGSFISNNLNTNVNRFRFKDYLTESVMDQFAFETDAVEDPFKLIPYKVMPTNTPGVTVYNNVSSTEKTINAIAKANPNVTFVYPATFLQIEGDAKSTNEARFKELTNGNAIPMMIGLGQLNDLNELSEEELEGIVETIETNWATAIQEANNVIKKGGQIALPFEGIGNLTTTPQELFISLSKTLLDNFGYVNPGSETIGTVFENLNQEINDAEILEMYDNENPLNC